MSSIQDQLQYFSTFRNAAVKSLRARIHHPRLTFKEHNTCLCLSQRKRWHLWDKNHDLQVKKSPISTTKNLSIRKVLHWDIFQSHVQDLLAVKKSLMQKLMTFSKSSSTTVTIENKTLARIKQSLKSHVSNTLKLKCPDTRQPWITGNKSSTCKSPSQLSWSPNKASREIHSESQKSQAMSTWDFHLSRAKRKCSSSTKMKNHRKEVTRAHSRRLNTYNQESRAKKTHGQETCSNKTSLSLLLAGGPRLHETTNLMLLIMWLEALSWTSHRVRNLTEK